MLQPLQIIFLPGRGDQEEFQGAGDMSWRTQKLEVIADFLLPKLMNGELAV